MSFTFKLPKRAGSQGKEGNNISPGEKPQYRSDKTKSKHQSKSELKSIYDLYHNPDPIARLIGKRNETTVIVDGEKHPGLLDSGAQMSTITISQAKKWV